jgi:hypothetical protein
MFGRRGDLVYGRTGSRTTREQTQEDEREVPHYLRRTSETLPQLIWEGSDHPAMQQRLGWTRSDAQWRRAWARADCIGGASHVGERTSRRLVQHSDPEELDPVLRPRPVSCDLCHLIWPCMRIRTLAIDGGHQRVKLCRRAKAPATMALAPHANSIRFSPSFGLRHANLVPKSL